MMKWGKTRSEALPLLLQNHDRAISLVVRMDAAGSANPTQSHPESVANLSSNPDQQQGQDAR